MPSLSALLQGYQSVEPKADVMLFGLTLDSRLVKSGDLFFACLGSHLDGRQFIADAISRGASAVLVEGDAATQWQSNIPIIAVPDLKMKIGEIAARFYDYPAKKMRVIGITGTNGKTSCSHFIAAALLHLQIPCGVIGTLGNGLYGNIQPGSLTTPDAISLQKIFYDFVNLGAKVVVMEVSSHSIDQGRINGITFDVGVFTNLSRDHLDYHGTMEAYGAVKQRLFEHVKQAVINADDKFGRSIIASLMGALPVYPYATQPDVASASLAKSIYLDSSGIHADVETPWGQGKLVAPLAGQFNVSNLLAVLTSLCLIDIPFDAALQSLSALQPVSGRMQMFGGKNQPLIVVDYAHKPDALEKVLQALRENCQGKLYCLFGCGGERDRGKRPMMASIAERHADLVVVTNDNPRHEDPKQIMAEILQGFTNPSKVLVEYDRAKAIHDVIQYAKVGDTVLIAGKGAETYQVVGDEKIPFSDIDEVIKMLARSNSCLSG